MSKPTNNLPRFVQWTARRIPLLTELPPEVTALSAVAFCVALGFGIVGPVIPAFAREFQVSAFAAGLVVSSFASFRLLGAPPAARFVDRFGERRVLTIGLAIVGVSSFTAGLAQTYWQLLLFRSIGGIGSIMFSVASIALLLRIVHPDQRGRAASAWSGGFLFGGLAGPALGGVFVAWSLRAPFFVYAATLAVASWLSWRTLAHAHLLENAVEQSEQPLTLRTAARLPAYRAVIAAQFANGFVRFGVANALITLYVVEVLKAAPAVASVGFFISSIGQVLLLSRAGRLTDQVGRRPMLLMGVAATMASQAILMAAGSIGLVYLGMLGMGLSGAFMAAAPAAVLGDVTHGHPRGPVVAASQMASDLGGVVGPILAGSVLDLTGSYPAGFGSGVLVLTLALGLVLAMPETVRKP